MSAVEGPRPRRPGPPEGEVIVFAADEQSDVEVDVTGLTMLAEQVLKAEGVKGACELSLYFVDEEAIAELNERFMGSKGPTDVLAFPIDDDLPESGRSPDGGATGPDRPPIEPSEVPRLLGDVVLCPKVAERNAPQHAGTYRDEMGLLVVHGILHVLGMDHADEEETKVMQARERQHLTAFWQQ